MVRAQPGLSAHELDSICHELRQPLAVIHAYAELMDDGLCGPLTGQMGEAVEAILRSTNTLDRGFSILRELGSQGIEPRQRQSGQVDVATLIEWIEDHFDLELKSGRQGLAIQVDDPNLAVVANEPSLRVALGVLVETTARSARQDTVIRLNIERRSDRVRFSVRTGSDAAARAPAGASKQGGQGGLKRAGALLALGMPTAKAAIAGMGGELECNKHRDGGDELAFELDQAASTYRI